MAKRLVGPAPQQIGSKTAQIQATAGVRNERLASGIELVHYHIPSTSFVEINLSIGAGSRHDPPRLLGIAHLLEHMFFRGCRELPTGFELNRAFERLGEGLNALTHKEFTSFTTRVPKESLGETLKLLASVLSEPLFHEIDIERGVVIEELLEELDDQGHESDIENISRKLIFGKHPLGNPVLGTLQSLKRIRREDLVAFHRAQYAPGKMVLSIAGGSGWEECFAAASRAFETFSVAMSDGRQPALGGRTLADRSRGSRRLYGRSLAQPVSDLRAYASPAPKSCVKFLPKKASQVEAILSFFMPGEQYAGELARLFLSRVLDDGISSRLQRTVCERRGLLYDISCGIDSMAEVALFDIQFSVSPAKLTEVMQVIINELRQLKEKLIEPEEFELVRGRFTRDVQSTAESARAMAPLLSEAFVLRLPFPVDPQEYQARLGELTPASVQREAAQAFTASRCAFVARGKVSPAVQREVRKVIKSLGS